MMTVAHLPFTALVVGLKGVEFLQKLKAINLLPNRIVSYDQPKDQSRSFSKIEKLANENNVQFEKSTRPVLGKDELTFTVGWQFLIKNSEAKLIVFHDSLLPKYRGFAPTVTALINGDTEIGVTALFANDKVDEGPIIAQQTATISYPLKIHDALQIQADIMSTLVADILKKREAGALVGKEQDASLATYSIWRDQADYFLDWSLSADELARTVNALGFPYEGAKCHYQNEVIVIHEAVVCADLTFSIRQPGKIWSIEDGCPVVVCGTGMLKIIRAASSNSEIVKFTKLRERFTGN
ncbi:methionyl-tRNA formyltransferase [Hyphococcus lacteus]|uniref:Formyltransferase family protein n=1 Tax=Hyphococcus lacteus TaxID=3143536 RepID=A0ABV3Z353_9PROT